jgi:hypothetical protein
VLQHFLHNLRPLMALHADSLYVPITRTSWHGTCTIHQQQKSLNNEQGVFNGRCGDERIETNWLVGKVQVGFLLLRAVIREWRATSACQKMTVAA